jgi:hypothetical protein
MLKRLCAHKITSPTKNSQQDHDPTKRNNSQQGHKDRKDRLFEFLKSAFVAFAVLL